MARIASATRLLAPLRALARQDNLKQMGVADCLPRLSTARIQTGSSAASPLPVTSQSLADTASLSSKILPRPAPEPAPGASPPGGLPGQVSVGPQGHQSGPATNPSAPKDEAARNTAWEKLFY